jgi:hypothetical protein
LGSLDAPWLLRFFPLTTSAKQLPATDGRCLSERRTACPGCLVEHTIWQRIITPGHGFVLKVGMNGVYRARQQLSQPTGHDEELPQLPTQFCVSVNDDTPSGHARCKMRYDHPLCKQFFCPASTCCSSCFILVSMISFDDAQSYTQEQMVRCP